MRAARARGVGDGLLLTTVLIETLKCELRVCSLDRVHKVEEHRLFSYETSRGRLLLYRPSPVITG